MTGLDGLDPETRAALLAEAREQVESDAVAPGAEPGTFRISRDTAEAAGYATPPPHPELDRSATETREERLDRLAAEDEAAAEEDYTEFWAAQAPGKTLRNVHGLDLVLPRSMPLRFEMEAERLKDRRDTASTIYLFDMLFGTGMWAELIKRGIDGEQLPVLLIWGQVNLIPGRSASLAEAKRITEGLAAQQAAGKVPDLDGLISGVTSAPAGA